MTNNSMSRRDYDYSNIAVSFNLPTIKSLHQYHDSLFFKIFNNYIDCNNISNLFLVKDCLYNLRANRIVFTRGG